LKIGVAGLGHETITFWPGTTGLEEFEREALHGWKIIEARRGTNTAIGGFIDVCENEGIELHPVCQAFGGATATVADEAFNFYLREIVEGFRGAKLDGVLLALHGAMVTESLLNPETHLVKAVRRVVGRDTPIMATLDLHGNLDPALLSYATAIFGYHSSPHTDRAETGRRAAKALLATLDGEIHPVSAVEKPGLVIPSVFSATGIRPAREIIQRLKKWMEHPGIVDASALFGFAWSDVPQIGFSAVVIADGDAVLAREVAQDLARLAWERRKELIGAGRLYSVEQGVARAIALAGEASRPIILLDHADRTNDTTFVLRELLSQGAEGAAVPLFYAPKAAQRCCEADIGSRVKVSVGGSTGWRDGGPLEVEGEILWAGEARYKGTGPMTQGLEIDLGDTAILEVNGLWLQVVSRRNSLIDEDPFIQFGYDPRDFNIILTKSKTHFRAVYEELGEEIIIVDAPGQCPADLTVFEYRNIPPGVYPITYLE
jgi:microcystin degradation protein MlrC